MTIPDYPIICLQNIIKIKEYNQQTKQNQESYHQANLLTKIYKNIHIQQENQEFNCLGIISRRGKQTSQGHSFASLFGAGKKQNVITTINDEQVTSKEQNHINELKLHYIFLQSKQQFKEIQQNYQQDQKKEPLQKEIPLQQNPETSEKKQFMLNLKSEKFQPTNKTEKQQKEDNITRTPTPKKEIKLNNNILNMHNLNIEHNEQKLDIQFDATDNAYPFKCPFKYCIRQSKRQAQIIPPLKYPNYDALKQHIHKIHLVNEQFETYYQGKKTDRQFWSNFCLEYKQFVTQIQDQMINNQSNIQLTKQWGNIQQSTCHNKKLTLENKKDSTTLNKNQFTKKQLLNTQNLEKQINEQTTNDIDEEKLFAAIQNTGYYTRQNKNQKKVFNFDDIQNPESKKLKIKIKSGYKLGKTNKPKDSNQEFKPLFNNSAQEIKLLAFNARSISNKDNNKALLEILLQHKYDIIIILETWINKENQQQFKNTLIQNKIYQDYDILQNISENSSGQGVLIFIKKEKLSITQKYKVINNSNLIISTISRKINGKLLFFVIGSYIPPVNKFKDEIDMKKSCIKLLGETIEQIHEHYTDPNIIIFADTNLDLSNIKQKNGQQKY